MSHYLKAVRRREREIRRLKRAVAVLELKDAPPDAVMIHEWNYAVGPRIFFSFWSRFRALFTGLYR